MGMIINPYRFGGIVVERVDSLDANSPSGAETSHSFAAVNLGPTAPDRIIVYCAHAHTGNSTRNFLSSTVGGVAARLSCKAHSNSTPNVAKSIFAIHDTTNTSATIVITLSGTANGWAIDVYSVTGTSAEYPFDDLASAVTSGDPTGTLNIGAGGTLIGTFGGISGSPGSSTWTGFTAADVDKSITYNSETSRVSSAIERSLAAETGRTVTASNGTTNEALCAVSFSAVSRENSYNPYDCTLIAATGLLGFTFSNSFKSALHANTDNSATCVLSRYAHSTGKYYFEFLIDTVGASTNSKGVGVASARLANVIGTDANLAMGYRPDGLVRRNSTTVATYATYTTADVICVALDLTNDMIWFRKNGGDWNNNAANDPAANTGGLDISALTPPLFAASQTLRTNDKHTLRILAADFTQAAPSGFGEFNY